MGLPVLGSSAIMERGQVLGRERNFRVDWRLLLDDILDCWSILIVSYFPFCTSTS